MARFAPHKNTIVGNTVLYGATGGRMLRQDLVLEGITRALRERFGISHTTIQVKSKAWPEIEQAQI